MLLKEGIVDFNCSTCVMAVDSVALWLFGRLSTCASDVSTSAASSICATVLISLCDGDWGDLPRIRGPGGPPPPIYISRNRFRRALLLTQFCAPRLL